MKNKGLASADGTGLSSSTAPEVAALRASIPDAATLETIEQCDAARNVAVKLLDELRVAIGDYKDRADAIRFGEADHNHPWLGHTVKRTETVRKSQGMWSRAPAQYVEKTTRGVVTLQGPERVRYRNYTPGPGETFVLSATGLTAYRLDRKWELASAQGIAARSDETQHEVRPAGQEPGPEGAQ